MKTVSTIQELRKARASLSHPLGLVPTMGFLHEGHLSLVRVAKAECKSVAASIFVNPTQFSPTEDLSDYPRDLEKDLALLEDEGTDLVWIHDTAEMYPQDFQTWVTVEQLTSYLEGVSRPEHFRYVHVHSSFLVPSRIAIKKQFIFYNNTNYSLIVNTESRTHLKNTFWPSAFSGGMGAAPTRSYFKTPFPLVCGFCKALSSLR